MADLINRDHAAQAIEAYLCNQCDHDTDRDHECIACPHLDGSEILKSVPAVNRWIPVEDALPERDKSYITYAKTTKYCNHNELPEEARINVLYFNGEEWYDEECRYYNVTHYMPLPEPPKE